MVAFNGASAPPHVTLHKRPTPASDPHNHSWGSFKARRLFGPPAFGRPHRAMVSTGFQILGIGLGVVGWIGAIVTCILPQWKVSAFVGNNIITAQTTWEGIWMSCVSQSTGQMQCKVYDSMLALGTDMKVSRALIVIAILLGIVALLLAIAGGKCTNCVEDEHTKAKVSVTAGAIFIIAGLLCLIPVSYTANTIVQDFYNPMITVNRMELGPSLFIGWGSAALLILGGGLLCSNCPPKGPMPKGYV